MRVLASALDTAAHALHEGHSNVETSALADESALSPEMDPLARTTESAAASLPDAPDTERDLASTSDALAEEELPHETDLNGTDPLLTDWFDRPSAPPEAIDGLEEVEDLEVAPAPPPRWKLLAAVASIVAAAALTVGLSSAAPPPPVAPLASSSVTTTAAPIPPRTEPSGEAATSRAEAPANEATAASEQSAKPGQARRVPSAPKSTPRSRAPLGNAGAPPRPAKNGGLYARD